MCVFIDFARLAAALRCCRNVVSIGRHGMLRLAVGTAVLLAAACLVAQEAAAQVSDAEIARAVRTVRNTEGLGLMRPSISAAVTITDDVRSRVDNALSLLGRRGSGDPDLIARIGDEFVRQDALEKLFGFKFGVGAAITSNRRNKAIKDATVNSKGIVRVTREDDTSVGYVLEAHYFFAPDRPFLNLTTGGWGIGPFVAIQGGNEKALSGLGFGLMIGFRQLGSALVPTSNLSWNFGIGAIYDPSIKVLGDGLVADRPVPVGDSARTVEVGSWGLMLVSSFNF